MKRVLQANEKGIKFEILSNPEFLAEGTAVTDLIKPDRVLIGGEPSITGQEAVKKLVSIYAHWVEPHKILETNLWSSELSKLVANAFLAQRISSINSISALCERSGADIDEVGRAIGMDSRIGSKFLKPSVGFGGSCFQKDILNLVYICESLGLPEVAAYWQQVVAMNEYQKHRFSMRVVKDMFNTVSGKKIALLGFAFKADTGDTRETPALAVANSLLEERACLSFFDPQVSKEQIISELRYHKALPTELDTDANIERFVNVAKSAEDACNGAHAIAIITEWSQFTSLDYQAIFDTMARPAFIFDGRNLLDHDALRKIGFIVYSIGKPTKDAVDLDSF